MALLLPLGPVLKRVVEVLVARHAKHATLLELLGQRDDVKVEEAELALVPAVALGRVECATTV